MWRHLPESCQELPPVAVALQVQLTCVETRNRRIPSAPASAGENSSNTYPPSHSAKAQYSATRVTTRCPQ